MRHGDIARLSRPYVEGEGERRTAPARALGVPTPSWDALERRIFEDLTIDPPYGVAWWEPHPGTSRRILISDQLCAYASSVSTSLVEAGLHWLELPDAVEREDEVQADVIQVVNGRSRMKARRRTTPLESLGPEVGRKGARRR